MRARRSTAAPLAAVLALFVVPGCEEADDDRVIPVGDTASVATAWSSEPDLTLEEIERGRLDDAWRNAASVDSFNAAWEESTGIRLADSLPRVPTVREGWDDLRVLAAEPVLPETGDLARPDTAGSRAAARPDTARTARGDVATSTPGGAADTFRVALPLHGDVEGPSVMVVQALLDRAAFSPGVVDGKWGRNTASAVYWFQRAEGLPPTGRVDSTTYRRLRERAGDPPAVKDVVLTGEDVAGPFLDVPDDPYALARMDCACYASLSEKLAERAHVTEELLASLNPSVVLDSLRAGDAVRVPNVAERTLIGTDLDLASARAPGRIRPATAGARVDTAAAAGSDTTRRRPTPGRIARVVVSDRGHYVHALDDGGRILWHFPATLGARFTPSPEGRFEVTSISFEPWFHYQPALLGEGSGPDARIPPGPNSPVGVVWMQLSKDHYGIHGTARPATIGYATSHGCVRLTNWDAAFLAGRIAAGVPVEFIDVGAGERPVAAAPDTAPAAMPGGGSAR